jgi:hypothetical protein
VIAITANPGATNYQYLLYKDGTLVQQSAVTTIRNYSFEGLSGGNYTIEIQNADHAGCTGWQQNITLTTVNPLSLQLLSGDSVSCYGGSDGRLQLQATGGSGSYTFTLIKPGGATISNNTGDFTGLAAGDYSVSLTNTTAGCNDMQTGSYSAPPLILATWNFTVNEFGWSMAKDCKNLTLISLSVSGSQKIGFVGI